LTRRQARVSLSWLEVMNKVGAMEKIDYEYEIFYLDCMRQSKAGIFARSDEIRIKREIKNVLKKTLKGNRDLAEKVNKIDNILEEAYRYICDNEERLPIETLVKRWMKGL
jgi:hypothetical protein